MPSASLKSAEAKKCLARSSFGTVVQAFETVWNAGSNSLIHSSDFLKLERYFEHALARSTPHIFTKRGELNGS